jgi:hypothetical protein
VQPAQLSLLPDQVPAPPPMLLAQLPENDVAAAITLLAHMIAKASAPATPTADTPAATTEGSTVRRVSERE